MTGNPARPLTLDHLLKLRLVVGRCGEMDLARWWNTQGMLGPRGAQVLRRGLPFTHYFSQARIVFAVARSRCQELFDPPGCMTLWQVPAELEEQFEDHWQAWLDEAETWAPFFTQLAEVGSEDLLATLATFDLIKQSHRDQVMRLRRSAEHRAVPLAGEYQPDDEALTLLAAAFARGEQGSPAIPYARLGS